jgi:tetratricopeptide (TPR) repeat protein
MRTRISKSYRLIHSLSHTLPRFAATFFIDGSCVPRIRADTTRHVRSLGTSHSQKGFEDCLRFLAQPCPGGRRLILYDNVDDPDIDLAPLLPLGNSCAIVVTSRNRSLGELCSEAHLELDTMSMDEAVDLFLHRSGPSTMITDRMREEASAISRELGCLPIALTQARSYMYQTQCSASEYHERLLNSRDKLLAKPVKHHRDMRYVSTYAAFDASFGLLPSRCRRLLQLLSCFHWSDFPLELVFLAAKYKFSDYRYTYSEHGNEYYTGRAILRATFLQDGNWDIAELDEMIIRLRSHSLITLTPGIGTQLVQMHPVAHGWVKSSITEKKMARYQSAAILLLALGSREEHTYCTQYLTSHITHFSTVWDQLHANNAEAFGHILDDGGTFEGALQLRRRVVTALRCQVVPDSKAITNALWYLALSYCRLGQYKNAEPLQREALRMKTEILGERHPDTINASINLANTYCDLGRLKEAETLQKGVLKLRKEILGERHPDTIMASSNLAATYNDMGRLKEAEVLREEVMELMKETLGERHPDTIKATSNLANTYCDLGRLKKAESLQEKVLGLRKEMLGECHPDTLSSTGNLALTYRDLGRLKEAEMLQDEVLRLMTEVLGERHPDTITASNNLAATYRHLGRLTEAESLQEEVLKLRMEMLGERHPDTLKASNNLANTYYSLGRLEEAKTLQEKVSELRNETLGERHPDTIKSSNNLASTYRDLGRLKEAEVLQEKVLKLRKEVLGRLHPDTLRASANLANYYRSLGKFKDAETLQVETLGNAQKVLGEQHPWTAAFMLTLAEIYESLHKKIDALKLLDTAESIFAKEFGKDHPRYLKCQQVKTRVHALPDMPNPVTALNPGTKIAPRNDIMARPSRIPKPCSNTSRTPTKPRRNHQVINRRRHNTRPIPC